MSAGLRFDYRVAFFGAALLAALPAAVTSAADPNPPATKTAPPTFDKTGPQVGDQLPDLKLTTLKGEPVHLSDAWHGGPALIVTSSFTCPKSRSRWPDLNEIAKKYDGKLNVVIVYVIEAHPVGSICPYKGVEEVTAENQRDGILRKQPATMDDRLDLAKEFKQYLRIDVPIYIDGMKNEAWKAFGAAPNKAFLVDERGIVAERQGWFDGGKLDTSIGPVLQKARQSGRNEKSDARDAEEKFRKKLAASGLDSFAIFKLVREENTDALSAALKKVPEIATYVEVHYGRGDDTTYLADAVNTGKLKSAKLLLDAGASLTPASPRIEPILVLAARKGDTAVVRLLLERRADPNVPASGASPLHEALINGNADVAHELIAAGAKEDLFSDIALGKTDKVSAAIAADPSVVFRRDGVGRSALDYAAANGQLGIAKLLIAGAAPAFVEHISHDYAPLHYAIKNGSAPMVELLLDAGHSPDAAFGWRGESASSDPLLHEAIASKNPAIVQLFIDHKANLEIRDTFSMTPLAHAASYSTPAIVELLIKAGADCNATQQRFSLPCGSGEEETPALNTPLHFAAATGNPEIIKLLVKAGAKIDARNVKGQTPLLATVTHLLYHATDDDGRAERIAALLDLGADINAVDKKGETILDHWVHDTIHSKAGRNKAADPQKITALLMAHGAKSAAQLGLSTKPASNKR